MPGMPAEFALRKARAAQQKNREKILKTWEDPIDSVNKLIESSAKEGKTSVTITLAELDKVLSEYDWEEFSTVISNDLIARGYLLYGSPKGQGSFRISWECPSTGRSIDGLPCLGKK